VLRLPRAGRKMLLLRSLMNDPATHAARRDAMRAGETELQMCVRHVAEQENRVAQQDVLVERLRESGNRLLDDALRLLAEMQDLLETMHDHVARLDRR
jgi:hypothetical protein